jgi:hypothetical protein
VDLASITSKRGADISSTSSLANPDLDKACFGYGRLPGPSANGVYVLDISYVDAAVKDVRMQLARAGVRLALVLNKTLGGAR